MDFAGSYRLKKPAASMESTLEGKTAHLVEELMNSAVSFHKLHLKITGPGSYAAHTALGGYYDAIPGLVDGVAEGFQGAHEVLLECGHEMSPRILYSVEDSLNYLRELSKMVNELQAVMPYSEVVNDLDNIKSLINSTKYKLKFLK